MGKANTPFFPPILLNMAILQSKKSIIIINLEIEGLTYEKENSEEILTFYCSDAKRFIRNSLFFVNLDLCLTMSE